MNLTKTLPLAAATALLAGSASAALQLHYDFESDATGNLINGGSITNSGAQAGNGTVGGTAGAQARITNNTNGPGGTSSNFLELSPSDETLEGTAAPHFNTGQSIDSVGLLGVAGDDDYTFAAYIRFDSGVDDNMVFGGGSGDVLHLGARGTNYWSGHWGDDVNSAGAPSTQQNGSWHHVAWTNDSATQTQTIYVDGVAVATGGGGATGGYTANGVEGLLVGTSRNRGSFRGALDDVRVYDNVLSGAEISALVVPEPTGIALVGLAGLSLMLRRRR